MEPELTFVIPAHNAAGTLHDALSSLQRQTFSNWRAIVVDDGSTDATADIAHSFAELDSRIQIVHQSNSGAAAARNAGVALASTRFISFLDADDWLAAEFATTLLPIAIAGGDKAIPCCFSRRVSISGAFLPIDNLPDLEGLAALAVVSERCPFAIHSAILPRNLYQAVGGMPLRPVCEDWELWVRVAFAGGVFIPVKKCLSFYRSRSNSLTSTPALFVSNAVEVIDIADKLFTANFGADAGGPTVPRRLAPPVAQLNAAVWIAGLGIRSGVEPAALLALLPSLPDILGHEELIASSYLHGISIALAANTDRELAMRHAEWHVHANGLFEHLDQLVRPGAVLALWSAVAQRMAASIGSGTIGPFRLETAQIETPRLFSGVWPDGSVVTLRRGERLIDRVQVPAGRPSIQRLFATAGQRWGWRTTVAAVGAKGLLRFGIEFGRSVSRSPRSAIRSVKPENRRMWLRSLLHRHRVDALTAVGGRLDQIALKRMFGESAPTNVEDSAARSNAWNAVFLQPDPWKYFSIYEMQKYQQTLSLITEHYGNALELSCAEGIFTQLLTTRVHKILATDISSRALERAAQRCQNYTNVTFQKLDLVSDPLPSNVDLIVCSEVLYYLSDRNQLRAFAEKVARSLRVGGSFVTAHAHLIADEPGRSGFDWDNLFGVKTICEEFSNVASLVLEETIETELYAVHRFRRLADGQIEGLGNVRVEDHGALEPEVERFVVWGGAIVRRSQALASERTVSVPVLMYHRIADDAHLPLARWSVSPKSFREHLRLLRRLGYYSISSIDILESFTHCHTLMGRPLLITFDDGYQDFAELAAPILEQNDFSAEIFLVTDKVGQEADWDVRYGTPAPLMNWETIRSLGTRGFKFGSHLASHRPAPYLTSEELLGEAVRSRKSIRDELGTDSPSVALPFGAYDQRVMPILFQAGYRIAFATDAGFARPDKPLLRLPRLEVTRNMDVNGLAALLDRSNEIR